MIAPARSAEPDHPTGPGAAFATRFDEVHSGLRPEAAGGRATKLPVAAVDGISRGTINVGKISAPAELLAFRGFGGGAPIRLTMRFRIGRNADERPILVEVRVMGGPPRLELLEPVRAGQARTDERNTLEVSTSLDDVPPDGLLIVELGVPASTLPPWLRDRLAARGLLGVMVVDVRMRPAAPDAAPLTRSIDGLLTLNPDDVARIAGAAPTGAAPTRVRLEAGLVTPFRWRSRGMTDRRPGDGARGPVARRGAGRKRKAAGRDGPRWGRMTSIARRSRGATIRVMRSGGGRSARLAARVVPQRVKRSIAGALVRRLAARSRLTAAVITPSTGVVHEVGVRFLEGRTIDLDLPAGLTEPMIVRLASDGGTLGSMLGRWLGWTVVPTRVIEDPGPGV